MNNISSQCSRIFNAPLKTISSKDKSIGLRVLAGITVAALSVLSLGIYAVHAHHYFAKKKLIYLQKELNSAVEDGNNARVQELHNRYPLLKLQTNPLNIGKNKSDEVTNHIDEKVPNKKELQPNIEKKSKSSENLLIENQHQKIEENSTQKSQLQTSEKERVIKNDATFKEILGAAKLGQKERTRLHGKSKDPVIETIGAIQKIDIHRETILKRIAEGKHKDDQNFAFDLIGFAIHSENPRQDTENLINNAPRLLFEGYEKAKHNNKLEIFFDQCFNFDYGCIEGCLDLIQEFLIRLDALENLEAALAPLPIPKVKKTSNKEMNILMFINFFGPHQARKYAHDHKIIIDAEWLEEKGTLFKILNNPDFESNYHDKATFIKFLIEEADAVGKETKEGPLNISDIEFISQRFVGHQMLHE